MLHHWEYLPKMNLILFKQGIMPKIAKQQKENKHRIEVFSPFDEIKLIKRLRPEWVSSHERISLGQSKIKESNNNFAYVYIFC
jgi:hypothetical protein